jgi:cysteine desulfurase
VRYRPQVLGTQEMERRGGTENVPGILGFGAAAEQAMSWLADPVNRQRGAELRDRFERRVLELCPDASINGPTEPGARLWNTTNIAFPRLEAEALLLLLSERGVAASAGAACSSGSLDPSPVLLAMGVPETAAHGSVRFSLSRETSAEEIDRAADAVAQAVTRLAGSAAGV